MDVYTSSIGVAAIVALISYIMFRRKISKTVSKVNESYDYVIVGAGSAGAVLAARLSEDHDVTVLLLEAGGEETGNKLFQIPLASSLLQQSSSDWEYYTVPQQFSSMASMKGKNRQYWPRGKVLGGCSMYNYMQYVRGSRHDYDEWAEQGCEGWSYADVLPYFIKSEDVLIPELRDSRFHGTGGPLGVSSVTDKPLANVFVEAGRELGYEVNPDYNGEHQEGFAVSHVTVRDGQRASTCREFLRPAMGRPNLHVVVNAHVSKVRIDENNVACGVDFEKDGTLTSVKAAREVILSAGAIGSPQILILSGIGPREHVEELGIPFVADLPVGENLQDHMLAFIASDISTKDSITVAKANSVMSRLKYGLFNTGPLTSTGLTATAFISSEANKMKYPDIQIHLLSSCPKLADVKFDQTLLRDMFHEEQKEGFCLVPIILHPKSRGTIRLASNNPYDHPRIDPNYLSKKADVDTFIRAFKIAQKMLETDAFKAIGASMDRFRNIGICEGLPFQSDEYYECLVRHVAQTVYHPTTTCKMGRADDPSAVVDAELRVKGVKNLRVVDASVMPNIVSGNTNAAVIMIAEKAADLVRGKDTVVHIRQRIESLG